MSINAQQQRPISHTIPLWYQIRWRMVFYFVLLAVLPVMLVIVIFGQRLSGQTFDDQTDQLSALASVKQFQIGEWIRYALPEVRALASGEIRRDRFLQLVDPESEDFENNRTTLYDIFSEALAINEGFTEFFFFDRQGNVLISSNTERFDTSIAGEPYLEPGLRDEYVQPPYHEADGETLAMIVTVPVLDDSGAAVGAVAGRLNLDSLNALLTDYTGLGETGETYLVSASDFHMLTPSRFEGYAENQVYHSTGIDRGLAGESGSGTYKNYRGKTVLGIYQWVPELQAVLMAEITRDETLLTLKDLQYFSLLLAGLFGLVAAAFGFFIATRMARPLVALTETATRISEGDLSRRAHVESKNEVGVLANALNAMAAQLQETIGSLEARVGARTRDLFLTLEVGQLATRVYHEQDLLPKVAAFIREQFDLYYTQIYLLDDARRYAVLEAGTGEVGQQLLDRQHRLELRETSIVGRAATSRQPVLVTDTTTSSVHRPNPLLPETRSEVAIPLMIGDEVIGVLDMQAVQPDTFNEENLPVFQAMANQLASALRGAQTYAEAQTAVERAGAINRRLTQERWESYLGRVATGECVGYEYDLQQVKPLGSAVAPSAKTLADGDGHHHVIQPISLRGQPIGTITVGEDGGREWQPDEIQLVEEVADRIALAVEQLRAFDETQAALTQTEQLYNANRRIVSAGDLQEVVAAVMESLGADAFNRGVIYLFQRDAADEIVGLEVAANWYNGVGEPPLSVGTVQTVSSANQLFSRPKDPLFISDTWNDARIPEEAKERAVQQNIRTVASLPLVAGGRPLGTFVLESEKPYNFTEATIRPFTALVGQVAVAVDNLQLLEQTQKRAAQLQTVSELSAEASSTLDLDQLLQRMCDLTKEKFDLYHAHIYLLDEAAELLVLASGAGEVGRLMLSTGHSIPLSNPRSVVSRAARTTQSAMVNMTAYAPDFLPNPLLARTKSELATPLIVGDRVIGVLDVQSDKSNYFTNDDIQIQSTLAAQIAVAVQNARLFAESSQRLAIIENSDSFIGLATLENQLIYVNSAGLRMSGYNSLDEIKEQSALELFMPEDVDYTADAIAQTHAQGLWHGENRLRLSDGSWLPVDQSAFIIRDERGEPLYIATIMTDITQRKLVETELEKQATELQTVAELSASTSTILDVPTLLQTVADLTKERFGLYHAHIYLLDEEGKNLMLTAGAGAVGRAMTAAQHRIPVDAPRSLVALAARTNHSVVVNSVTQTPDYLPNPMLPLTRSEMAIPMIAGNNLIGVLDVQSDELDHFTAQDEQIQTTLAAQVASTVQNARLFEAVQKTSAELQDQLKEAAATQDVSAYGEENLALEEYLTRTANRIPRAMKYSDVALAGIHFGDEVYGDRRVFETSSKVTNPLVVGGETIGSLVVGYTEEREFLPEELPFLRELAGRVSIYLDNRQLYEQTQQALSRTQMLYDGSRRLLVATTPDELLHTFTDPVSLHDQCDGSLIYVQMDDNGEPEWGDVVALTASEAAEDVSIGTRYYLPEFPLSRLLAAQPDRSVVISDIDQPHEALDDYMRQTLSDLGIGAVAVIPMKIGRQWSGIVKLAWPVPHRFTEAEEQLFNVLGPQAATLIENQRLLEQTQRRAAEMQVVVDVSTQVSTLPDVEQMLWDVSNTVKDRFGLYHAHIYLTDETGEELVLAAGSGLPGQAMVSGGRKIRIDNERSLVARAARTQEGVTVNDVTTAGDFMPNPMLPLTRSEMAIPMIAGGQVLGVLDVQSEFVKRFTTHDVQIQTTLAGQVAAAIQNSRLFAQNAQRLAIIENSDDLIALSTLDNRLIYMNPTGLKLVGRASLDEAIDMPLSSLHAPDDLSVIIDEGIPAAIQGTAWHAENRLLRADGTLIPVDQTLFAVRDEQGELAFLATIMTDITERKQAEAERREREQLMSTILNASPDWIYLKDLNFRYVLVNEGFARDYAQLPPEDVVGKDDYDLGTPAELIEGNPEKGIVGFRVDDRQVLETGEPVYNPFNVVNFSDGTLHLMDTNKLPLTDANGKVIGVLGVARDVTEREALLRRQRAAYELGQQLTTLLDPGELLSQTVDNLSTAFGYYHTHIFLYNEDQQALVVREGAGQAGALMKQAQHSIPLSAEQSLVARAGRTLKPVAVNDVGKDPNHLPNPLLPDTLSEVAIPLFMGTELLGVLDVQHNVVNYFTESEIQTLSIIAGQLSVSLSNARLFAESAQRLAIIENSDSFIALTTLENQLVYINPAGMQMAGYDSLDAIKDRSSFELFTPEDTPYVSDAIAQTFAQGSWHGENQLRRSDGSALPVDQSVFIIRDEHDKPLFFAMIMTDITERKEAEAELFEREQLLSAVINASPDWIFLKDPAYRYILANQAFIVQNGYASINDLLNKDDYEIGYPLELIEGNPEKGIVGFRVDDQKVIEHGETVHNPYDVVQYHDGSTHILDMTKLPLTDVSGNSIGVLGIGRDVTEREQLLAETRALYEVGRRLVAADDYNTILEAAAEYSLKNGAFAGNLITFETDKSGNPTWGENIAVVSAPGAPAESGAHVGQRFHLPDFPFAKLWLAEPDNPQLIPDVENEPSFDEVTRQTFLGMGTKATAMLPLTIAGRWLGMVSFTWSEPHEFDDREARFYSSLVTQMAAVLSSRRLLDQTEKRAADLQTVSEVSVEASTSLDPTQLLESVSNLVVERFDLYHAHVYLLDDKGERARLAAGARDAGHRMVAAGHGILVNNPTSLVARAVRTRETVVVNDVRTVLDFLPNPLLPKTRSEMALPMIAGGRVIGVLDVQSDEVNRFSDEDVAIQSTLASQIAVSVQNARLFSEATLEADRRTLLFELGRQLSQTLDPGTIAQIAVDNLAPLLDISDVGVYRLDAEKEVITQMAGYGSVGSTMVGISIPLASNPSAARAIANRKPEIESDITTAGPEYELARSMGFTAAMVMPVFMADQVLGLLFMAETRGPRTFSDAEIQLANSVANQVGVALQNAFLYSEQVNVADQLRQVDRLKSEFLASMSHELRTPLNSIIGYAEVLLDGIDGELTDDMLEDVTAIHGSGKHLLNLINDILDLAKIEAGHMDLMCEPVVLKPFVQNLFTTSKVLLMGKSVELLTDIDDNLPELWADSLRLRQVISNLISNAIKFTQEGSITVQARLHEADPNMVRISVIDTGIGISEEALAIVFDRFRQVDQGATRRVGGTGLGLAITKQLINMHGGDIWVESEPGVGSVFSFTLPIAPDKAE